MFNGAGFPFFACDNAAGTPRHRSPLPIALYEEEPVLVAEAFPAPRERAVLCAAAPGAEALDALTEPGRQAYERGEAWHE